MSRHRYLPLPEFIAMMAAIFATLAFSLDAMLPAFPAITAELTPDEPNSVQLVLLLFAFGMGTGTFLAGPLSDRFGRRPVILGGFAIYIFASAAAFVAPSLTTLLAARFVQGIGASAPRVVGLALMRDLYEGRRMAQLGSFVMTVFLLIPAVAPLIGQGITHLAGWRGIFVAYILFALLISGWFGFRQAESLAPENKRQFNLSIYLGGIRDVLARRDVVLIILVLSFGFGQMFALLSTTQQIYEQSYDQAENFPWWFMLTAAFSAVTTIINGRLVMKVGMKRMAMIAYLFQVVFSSLCFFIFYMNVAPQDIAFWIYFAWSVSVFFMAGLTFGNLNALAMQPLGHLAGMGATLIGGISTVLSALIAIPISRAFAGTPVPLMLGTVICSLMAALLLRPVKPVGR